MNTCDQNQVWTSTRCDNQEAPQLTVQNLTFANANSKGETKYDGGGAIYASGGRLKVINSRFTNNVCADSGFFVNDDQKTGSIAIDSSVITNNIGGSWYPQYPQISEFGNTPTTVANSTIQ